MKNSADQGGCYPRRPSASVDNTIKICRILHILQKPNSIIALLSIQNILPFRSLIFRSPTITQPCPQVFCQWFNNLQRAALLTSF